MKKLFTLACLVSCTLVNGQEFHQVGGFTNYHLEQESMPGFGLQYLWQFDEAFQFETNLIASGDIEKSDNDISFIGDYSQLLFGSNFVKYVNNDFSIKAGAGFSYVINTSNDNFIEQSSIAPYIKLAVNYQISKDFSIEAGQFSHFHDQILSNNHSIFLGVNYRFGETNQHATHISIPSTIQQKTAPQPEQTHIIKKSKVGPLKSSVEQSISTNKQPQIAKKTQLLNHTTAPMPAESKKASVNNMPVVKKSSWVIQLGAYANKNNANKILINLREYDQLAMYHVLFANDLFRIVSPFYQSKEEATIQLTRLTNSTSITGFIRKISH